MAMHDITIRLRRKDGRKVTAAEARKALWAAHKIAQHGGNPVAELREWDIEAIDWRKEFRSGRTKSYRYAGSDAAAAITDMGGILEDIGMAGLRVEVAPRKGR
jgi:hypothetical protein